MKKLVLVILSIWMVASISAQSVKPKEVTAEDYLPLLRSSGYTVYPFDISDFLDETYHFTFKIKEYVDAVEDNSKQRNFILPNRIMLSEFPKESQESILKEGKAIDPPKGIYMQSQKMSIGLIPSQTDSIQTIHINMDGLGESKVKLNLKPIKFPKNGEICYEYGSVPFSFDKFEEGKFIPLVFFASFWVDEKYGFLRFCGVSEIPPTMESDYVENTPHYYVIGVEINKKN